MQSAGCVKKRLAAQLHTLGFPVDGSVGGWAIVSLWRTVVVVTSVIRANCYCRQTMLTCMLTLYICRTRLYLEFGPRTLIGLSISSSFLESTVYGTRSMAKPYGKSYPTPPEFVSLQASIGAAKQQPDCTQLHRCIEGSARLPRRN